MESHFAALKIHDTSDNNQPESNMSGIVRAFSYTDLPSKSTIVKEWTSLQKAEPNLYRRYSCQLENLSNKGLTSSCSIIEGFKNDAQKFDNFIEQKSFFGSIPKFTSVNKQKIVISAPSSSMQNEIEYMEVEEDPKSNDETTNQTIMSVTDLNKKMFFDFIQETSGMKEFQKEMMRPIDLINEKTSSTHKMLASQGLNNEIMNMRKVETNGDRAYISRERDAQLKPKSRTKLRCFRNSLMFITVLSFLVGLMSIIIHQEKNRHSRDFVDAVAELKKRVYGQDQAVEMLSEYLLLDEPSLKVIALIGGTGVGKSYTVEIIKKNFPRQYYVNQFWYPPTEQDALFTLYPQLLVLENLREHDLKDCFEFLRTFQQAVINRHITVLSVFNFERMENGTRVLDLNESVKMLQSALLADEIHAKVIPYGHMNENALEKCIADAIVESGLTLSAEEIDLVKQYLFAQNTGCKGAYAKVQLIGNNVYSNIMSNTVPSNAD